MMKKVLFMALTILLTLSLVGCGGDTPTEKPAQEKKEVTADKAVVTYAELLMTGESATAGDLSLTDAEKAEIVNFAANTTVKFLGNAMPLSDKSAQAIAAKMHELSKQNMKFTATIKKDDPEHPIVEIKTTPWTPSGTANEEVERDTQAWIERSILLQAGGVTPEQLKENDEFQALAVKAITGGFSTIVFNTEKPFEVTCNKVNGHWAPENVENLYYFLIGVDIEALRKILDNPEAFQAEGMQDLPQQQQ